MDTKRFREVTSMPNQLNRYNQPAIVTHIASQYVLGHLSLLCSKRTEKLRIKFKVLDEAIHFWQEQLVHFDEQTPPQEVFDSSWQNITNTLGFEAENSTLEQVSKADNNTSINVSTDSSKDDYFLATIRRFFTNIFDIPQKFTPVFSVLLLSIVSYIGYFSFNNIDNNDALSYVAVLTNNNEKAHLVASTYGESQKLILNVIQPKTITEEQSLELWVVSKTDGQARSLGTLPTDKALVEQSLSTAQWRLIKDSLSLIVTVEELGGSALGEPSDIVVSRGLCVRLEDWKKNA